MSDLEDIKTRLRIAKSKLQNKKSIYGFGDDLGYDDFEPDNSPLSKIAKQQNKIS